MVWTNGRTISTDPVLPARLAIRERQDIGTAYSVKGVTSSMAGASVPSIRVHCSANSFRLWSSKRLRRGTSVEPSSPFRRLVGNRTERPQQREGRHQIMLLGAQYPDSRMAMVSPTGLEAPARIKVTEESRGTEACRAQLKRELRRQVRVGRGGVWEKPWKVLPDSSRTQIGGDLRPRFVSHVLESALAACCPVASSFARAPANP
jgi:hypothetical protein